MMNPGNSIANLLLAKREVPASPVPAAAPGPDVSFHATLKSNIERHETNNAPRPVREERRESPEPPRREDTPERESRMDQERETPHAREREKTSDRSDVEARERARESKDNNHSSKEDHDERGSWESSEDAKAGETKQVKDSSEPGREPRAKKVPMPEDNAPINREFFSTEDKPRDSTSPIQNADEHPGFLQDVLSASLAAARENVSELKDQAAKSVKKTGDGSLTNNAKTEAPMKPEADSARTIDSMVTSLFQDIREFAKGETTNRKKSNRTSAKAENNAPIREGEKKGEAKEPVVKVTFDENKWKVAGDVARTSENRTTEFRVETQPSKYAKSSGKNTERVSTTETRTAPTEINRETTADTRVAVEAGQIRREAGVDPRRASAEHKAQLADNRKAFNDMVEKARLNLGPDGRSSASMRLNPAHLGRMTINLQMNQNHLQAKVLVENQEARRMLMDDMDFLQRELRIHGIQIESFSIRVREPQSAAETGNQLMDNKGSDANAAGAEDKNTGDRGDDEPGHKSGGDTNEINEDSFETVQPGRKDAGLVNISV